MTSPLDCNVQEYLKRWLKHTRCLTRDYFYRRSFIMDRYAPSKLYIAPMGATRRCLAKVTSFSSAHTNTLFKLLSFGRRRCSAASIDILSVFSSRRCALFVVFTQRWQNLEGGQQGKRWSMLILSDPSWQPGKHDEQMRRKWRLCQQGDR